MQNNKPSHTRTRHWIKHISSYNNVHSARHGMMWLTSRHSTRFDGDALAYIAYLQQIQSYTDQTSGP